MKKMRVAVIGQGRSGRNIHGAFFKSEQNIYCDVVVVAERDEFRRKRAAEEYGCETIADYKELFGRKDIDVVVNASYSNEHYQTTKELLLHGMNVLVEKPFARTEYECSELIKIAKEKGVILAVFHQTLLNPMFSRIKEIIAEGKLGEIVQIGLRYSGFARRWDWQTLQCFCGGGVYNTGPHPIGQALALLGWDKNVRVEYSKLGKCLTSGDANDFAKIILSAPNKPCVDIEIISADAYSDYTYKIYGTKGTLKATNAKLEMTYIVPSELEARPIIRESLSDSDGYPIYCSEKLDKKIEIEEVKGTSFDIAVEAFYHSLYDAVTNGSELSVTPEMARDVIKVIEQCHSENPLPVIY